MRRRQLEARLARELSSGAGLSMQDYDVLSALTGVGDQRWRAKDLATHLLWSPARLSHHVDRMQRRELTNTPRRLPGRTRYGRRADIGGLGCHPGGRPRPRRRRQRDPSTDSAPKTSRPSTASAPPSSTGSTTRPTARTLTDAQNPSTRTPANRSSLCRSGIGLRTKNAHPSRHTQAFWREGWKRSASMHPRPERLGSVVVPVSVVRVPHAGSTPALTVTDTARFGAPVGWWPR
jgi:hypothetical protein